MANTIKKWINIIIGADPKKAIDAYNRVEAENSDLAGSYEKLFDDLEKEANQFKRSIDGVGEKTKKELDEAKESTSKFEIGLEKAIDRVKKFAAAIGAVLVGVLVKGANSMIDFNGQLGLISTMMDRSKSQVMEFGDEIRSLGVEMGIMPEQMADAGFKLTSAIGDVDNSLDIMRDAAELSVVSFGSLEESLDFLINAEKAAGAETGTLTAELKDMLLKAAALGDFYTKDFIVAFKEPMPFIKSLGVSMRELAASFSSTVGPAGSVQKVGTNLTNLFSVLLKPTGDLEIILSKMGFSSAKAAIQSMGFIDALKGIRSESEKSGKEFTKVIGSIEASKIALALTDSATEEYREELRQLQDAQGTAREGFSKITEGAGGLAFNIKQLKASFEVFTQRVAENAIESDRAGGAIKDLRDLFADPSFAQGIANVVKGLVSLATKTIEIVSAVGQLSVETKKFTDQSKSQADEWNRSFDRTKEAITGAGLSLTEFNKKVRDVAGNEFDAQRDKAEKLREELRALEKASNTGFVSSSILKKKTLELAEAEAELASIASNAARALIIESEKYGISNEIKEKAQDILRGTITQKEKETKARNENTKSITREAKAVFDFGQPVDELTENLDDLDKAFDFKFHTDQLDGVSGLIDEVSDVLQEGEKAQEAFNRQVEIEGKLIDEASSVLSEHAKLVDTLNSEYGAGIPILKDSEKEREKLIKAIIKMTGATREEAAAIVDNYLEWQRLKEAITSTLYVLSDAAGVIGPFIGLSEKAAGAIGGLSSGFAEMMSGNLIGGAMSILGDFGNIAEGVIDILHGGKEPVLSFSDAINQAGDLMEYFGVEGEQAKNTLALFLQEVAEGNRELSDFSGFIQDTTRNLDTMGESVWGSMIGLDGLSDSMSDFEKLMSEVNLTVGDTRKKLEDVSDIKAIFEAGAAGPGQFQNQIEILNNRFAQMVQAGTPVAEAIQLLDGAFDSLTDSAEKLGLTGSESFQELLKYRDLLKENQGVIDAIGGIGGALEDTFQFAGEGGRDVFQNFIEEALANFDKLKKAGFEPGQALATMGPVLTQIQDIAEKFGFSLGENISQLIAAADEAGALSEIDPMASAAESLESTAEALERIVQLLSGIPAGAGQALAGVTSMQGMNLQAPIAPTVQIPQMPNLQAIMNRGLPPSIPTAGQTQPQKIYNITIQPGAVQGGNIDISPTASTQEIAEAIQRDGGLVEIMADKIKTALGGL